MFQRVAVCCSVLQCVAVRCSVLHTAKDTSPVAARHPLQCAAVCCSVLQCVAVCCSVLQCIAVCCRVLHTAKDTSPDEGVARAERGECVCLSMCLSLCVCLPGADDGGYPPPPLPSRASLSKSCVGSGVGMDLEFLHGCVSDYE